MQSARAHTPLSRPPPPPLSDRAAERRAGLNPDYADVDAALAPAVGPLPALAAFAAPAVPLTAEETKFLGGDTAHTHLVKGLDYALLARVRSERANEEVGVAAEEPRVPVPAPAAPAPPKPDRRAATLAASLLAWLEADDAATAAAAARAAARAADAGAAPAPPAPRVPTFLPRRTAYVYELGGEDEAGVGDDGLPLLTLAAPPTTLARAAADCPRPRATATAAVDAALLERLTKILAYVGGGGAPKKGRKAARAAALAELTSLAPARGAPAAPLIARTVAPRRPMDDDEGVPPPVAAADEEDDIFGDAGRDYEAPAPAGDTAPAAPAAPTDAPSYFGAAGGASIYADLPLASAAVAAEAAGVPVPAAAGAKAATRRAARVGEEEEDAYAELYPDAGAGFGADMYSDDEEKGGDEGEADKAAGGKPGAKQPSARARERAAGAKLDSELAQIKTLLEKDGADVEAAFAEVPKGGKGTGKQAQAQGGDGGGGGGGAPTKRRRLAAD